MLYSTYVHQVLVLVMVGVCLFGIPYDLSKRGLALEYIIYDAASNENAEVAGYVRNNGWNVPLAVSNDLILITNNMPSSYHPNKDAEDGWNGQMLTTTKEYTVSGLSF